MKKHKVTTKAKMDDKLSDVMNQIDKLYGTGALFKYGDGVAINVEVISFGSLKINNASGIGGAPRGRIIEIYGQESSGKTTLCLHIIAEAQKSGGLAAFIDAEHALDINYAKKLGVNMKEVYLSQPDYGEQGLQIAEMLVKTGKFDVIVVDSVAALTPRSEIEGDMGDPQMASHARLMSQALRKLAGIVSKSKTCLIFVNQLRSKIGIMFGNPETTTGGNALKFYASQRIDIRRIGINKDAKGNAVSNKTKVKFVKNKLAPPFKECEIEIRFGIGIDYVGELIDIGIDCGVITKSGAWFVMAKKRFQGKEQLRQKVQDNSNYFNYLKNKITGEGNGNK
jgi:recombination protein RecA